MLEDYLEELKSENWRDVSNSLIYVRCPQKMDVLKKAGFDVAPANDGVLALAFVNHNEGLSLYVIAAAHIRNDSIFVSKENKSAMLIFNVETLLKDFQSDVCKYLNQNYIELDFNKYSYYADLVIKKFENDCEEAADIRKIFELDDFRRAFFPDDIEVILICTKTGQEKTWVRVEQYGDNCLYGKLLTEPSESFGIHKGDLIDFMLVEQNGKLSTVHVEKD